jgi:hypothetical protein
MNIFRKRKNANDCIKEIIIEKLSQLENNELNNNNCAKRLAELINENKDFVKIYNEYKKRNKK